MMKNERGYALVIVLVAIVVIGLMSVPLVEAALNSSTQAERSEQLVKAADVRDIGIKYARETIIDVVENSDVVDIELMAERLRAEVDIDGVTLPNNVGLAQSFDINAPTVTTEEDRITLTYTSVGQVGSVTETREETLRLRLIGGNTVDEDAVSGVRELYRKYQDIDANFTRWDNSNINGEDITFSGDMYFSRNFNVLNDSTVLVEGDAAVEDRIGLNKDSTFTVNGYFFHVGGGHLKTNNPNSDSRFIIERDMLIDRLNIQNQTRLCVRGNVYQVDRSGNIFSITEEEFSQQLVRVASCDGPLEQGKINYEGQNFSGGPGGPSEPTTFRWSIESIEFE